MAGTVKTPVDMANRALQKLSEPPIQAFDTSSTASRWFKSNYEAYRDSLIAMHDWDFAVALKSVAKETSTPVFRWKYQYGLPADFLRLPIQRKDGSVNGPRIPLEVIGQKIMTDEEPPFPLRYVRRVTTENEFSALFVEAFALWLAAGAAHVITGKNSLVQTLQQQTEKMISEAKRADAMQSGVHYEELPDVEIFR